MCKDIKEQAALEGPQLGEIEFKDAKKEMLLKEFRSLWNTGQIKDVHDYAKHLDSLGYEKAFQ